MKGGCICYQLLCNRLSLKHSSLEKHCLFFSCYCGSGIQVCLAQSSSSGSLSRSSGVDQSCSHPSTWWGRICHRPHPRCRWQDSVPCGQLGWVSIVHPLLGTSHACFIAMRWFHRDAHRVSASVRVSKQEKSEREREREMTIFYIFILEMTSYPVTSFIRSESLGRSTLKGRH